MYFRLLPKDVYKLRMPYPHIYTHELSWLKGTLYKVQSPFQMWIQIRLPCCLMEGKIRAFGSYLRIWMKGYECQKGLTGKAGKDWGNKGTSEHGEHLKNHPEENFRTKRRKQPNWTKKSGRASPKRGRSLPTLQEFLLKVDLKQFLLFLFQHECCLSGKGFGVMKTPRNGRRKEIERKKSRINNYWIFSSWIYRIEWNKDFSKRVIVYCLKFSDHWCYPEKMSVHIF